MDLSFRTLTRNYSLNAPKQLLVHVSPIPTIVNPLPHNLSTFLRNAIHLNLSQRPLDLSFQLKMLTPQNVSPLS